MLSECLFEKVDFSRQVRTARNSVLHESSLTVRTDRGRRSVRRSSTFLAIHINRFKFSYRLSARWYFISFAKHNRVLFINPNIIRYTQVSESADFCCY